jgi:penicillin-binding protein 1A
MNDVLKDVIAYGTGAGADIGRPNGTAGKTGTSEDYGDAWFVGYTPQLSTAVWMGNADSRRPLANVKGQSRVYGGTFAAPTWKAYMTAAGPELNLTDFAKPGPPPTIPPSNPGGRVSTPAPQTTPTTARATAPIAPQPTLPRPTLPPLTTPTTRVPPVSPTSIYRPPATTPTTFSPPTPRFNSSIKFPP